MRLTHLKLAGFKSFVDPTTIHVHGQRVGVVGPNGCGKSNVMESVRWVLGESSAREMRADAMDAVIFNGSSQRKPISRASVELVFDNSLGGASGEWNQYAEISVKRVIERDKGSSYFINNTAVRRRDVADLFLGTGLGGRAYAIIGQNTISRIVEARPEELRVFLEEAAGISKYKERRRETELRLRDTRENLARVEDISRELNKQIVKLEAQALVTQKYLALQQAFTLAEAQCWWLRQRDALMRFEAANHAVEDAVNALEAQMAALRSHELQLEQARLQQQVTASQLHDAQAAYYEANAQVSNLSLQVKQSEEARDRLLQQQHQWQSQRERGLLQQNQLQRQIADKTAALAQASLQVAAAAQSWQSLQQAWPEHSGQLQQLDQAAQAAQQALQYSRQQQKLELNKQHFLQRNLEEGAQRVTQIQLELAQSVLPDMQALALQKQQLTLQQSELDRVEQQFTALRQQEAAQHQHLSDAQRALQLAQRHLQQLEAETHSLQKLQKQTQQDAEIAPWVQSQALQNAQRLWQAVQIDAAWQLALEAWLGPKLNALLPEQGLNLAQMPHPQAALAIAQPTQELSAMTDTWQGLPSVYSLLKIKQPTVAGALQHWLAGVYALDDLQQLPRLQAQLPVGATLLTQAGDSYQRHSVNFHGRQTPLQGVLERQQQLDQLQAELAPAQVAVALAVEDVHASELVLNALRVQQQHGHLQVKQLTASVHGLQLEISRTEQAHDSALQRQATLKQALNLASAKQAEVEAEISQVQQQADALQAALADIERVAEQASTTHQQMAQQESALREQIRQAENTHQALVFEHTLLENSLHELQQRFEQQAQELEGLRLKLSEGEQAISVSQMESLKAQLVDALNTQHLREQALAMARNALAEQDATLLTLERARLQMEQQLHPLRDQVEQTRLEAQASRLQVEQCQQAVFETGLAEAAITHGLNLEEPVSSMTATAHTLQQRMQQLGAVNMAAIEELTAEQTRKGYLDSQLQDLRAATETLEEAIQKIDRETRGKLRATFDAANQHFGELFYTLFNGGQAKLALLGDEILDTGVQVFAQPPGKKNTTIQLLSGGEKALTAMALVFALFKLNPAPFCLMDEVDAPLDDSNTERFCQLVKEMSQKTQFLFVSHNKITMEMSQQLIGVTMQESGVSRIVDVDIDEAIRMHAA